jgi:hypothetical protein
MTPHPDQRLLSRAKRWWAYRWHEKRLRERAAAERRFIETSGLEVQGGLFKGMKYIDDAVCGVLAPKLIGSYEAEIADVLGELSGVSRVVDVGSAEGYYAVGLAMFHPELPIIAFDMDLKARALLARLAELNGVAGHIEQREEASPEALAELDLDRALLIVDCEGYEDVLLDPVKVPGLAGATMVVEIHDMFVPGLSERLRDRFAVTHDVELRKPQKRNPREFPMIADYPDAALLLDEARAPTDADWHFGLFRPKRR